MRRNEQDGGHPTGDGEGEQTVMAMTGGWRIVRMSSATALDRESALMGHCVGGGGFDRALEVGTRQLFSLWDARNRPHATFEVDPLGNTLLQCRGKGNRPPVARYMPLAQAFVRRQR